MLNWALRIFLRVIAQSLQSNSHGAAQVDKAALHIGAVAFIHRFGSSLNGHVHFHVCVVDGVFEEVPGEGDADADVRRAAPDTAGTDRPHCGAGATAAYAPASLLIYDVFPLLCPKCGGQMRLIAFITEGTQTHKILDHIGVDSEPPHISPARGPPLWDDCDAQTDEGVHIEPDWDLAAQPAPDYEVDRQVNW